MTCLVLNGHVVGWAPDTDPEWQFMDDEDWHPVVDNHLSVLIRADREPGKTEAWEVGSDSMRIEGGGEQRAGEE